MFLRRVDIAIVAAVIAGVALASAFPRPDFYPVAWIALVPLIVFMERRPFVSGFTAGVAFFAPVLYWLNIVMTSYGGLQPIFSLLAYLFLIVYLSLYFGLATWLSCLLKLKLKLPFLLTMPLLWVALEYLRGSLLTGFPWALLGYSQQNFSAAIQSADVTGVYGVSFLLVAVNCALAWIVSEPDKKWSWLGAAAVLLMTVTHVGYGVWMNSHALDVRSESLRVSLIQGDIDQSQKWVPENRQATVDKYEKLSQQALQDPVDLLIWPEAATPFFLQDETDFAQQVRSIPGQMETSLLLGSPAYQRLEDGRYKYFNSAFLLQEGKQEGERSDKIHLVPFGEYVPLGQLLTFINKMVVGVGDFSPGRVKPLILNDDPIGTLICYEVIFPELARDYVRKGSKLLVNLTNDAWFGRSSAPYQHLAMSRFRAIENRIWLARAANTGISAFIAPSGRVVSAGPIFQPLHLTETVGLGAEETFYTRFGDIFAFFCLAASGLFITALLIQRWLRR
jgi:apolipoprotein N-acyltransferase